MSSISDRNGLTPVAAAILGLLGLTSGSVRATSVSTCADSGDGSLRSTIAAEADGGTVDFSGLSHCTISLTTGEIAIAQHSLTIIGNPAVPIDGTGNVVGNGLFSQTVGNTGVLTFSNVTMGSATKQGGLATLGGCILSQGSVSLEHSTLDHCVATGTTALGGAIATVVGVTLLDTRISNSEARSASAQTAYGGAVFTNGKFVATYSTLSGNAAAPDYLGSGRGGAVFAKNGADIRRSTFSSNKASVMGGAVMVTGGSQFILRESTVSGNLAGQAGGVVVGGVADVTIDNSTIAFNIATQNNFGAGLLVRTLGVAPTDVVLSLHSTLISNNLGSDFNVDQGGGYTLSIGPTSSNNLIRGATNIPLPPDTKILVCPHLAALRNNGGPTSTHALNSGSIAIDAGSNPSGDPNDQRGAAVPGDYPRESPSGVPDIGAYEVDESEIVFTNDNEGCGT